MFDNVKTQLSAVGLGFAALVLGAIAAPPVSAQSVIIINGSVNGNSHHYRRKSRPTVGNFIYGSPISTPVPVNPITGNIQTQNNFYKPRRKYRRRKIYNPTLINPVLVDPVIITNPRNRRIRRNSRQRGYYQPNSRVIINSPW